MARRAKACEIDPSMIPAGTETTLGPRIPDARTMLLDMMLRVRIKRFALPDVTDAALRKTAAVFRAANEKVHTPPFVGVTRVDVNGRTAEWVTATDAPGGDATDKVILYFHGGGFFFSSPREHRPLVWRLARYTSRRVLAIDYRKAPDHAFPAWAEDARAAYDHVLGGGVRPADVVLAGDSAGGNIALALAQRLRDERVPPPGAVVLFSPWADLACTGRTYVTKSRRDAMFSGESCRALGEYLTRGRDVRDPAMSPLYGEFRGLPRMLVFAGSTEVFLDDARTIVRRASAAGVDARLAVFRHMPHIFPMFASAVPRAKAAFPLVASFLG